jgi:copper chaperone
VLQAVPGVDAVDVSLEKGEAQLRFDPARAGAPEIRKAIEDAGFEAA